MSAAPGEPDLAGIRVIELSSYVAAPFAGLALARLGADVLRVEPLGGQVDRSRMPRIPGGPSLYWTGLNQGKRSLAVDLRSDEGRELVAELVERAGVLVTNAAVRGLDDRTLRARRSDLIHVQLNGRRDGGTAVDYTVQAEVGLHDISGPAGHDGPVNSVLPSWDLLTGLHVALAVVAAERHRERTGEGRRIEIALHDVALGTLGTLGYLAEAQLLGPRRERGGNDVYGAFGRDFACADGGRLMVVALTARHWRSLVDATGLREATDALAAALDRDFAEEADRYEYRAALGALLEPWFAGRPAAEAAEALRAAGVLVAPYRRFEELVADGAAALAADPLFGMLRQPGAAPHLAAGSPVVEDGVQLPPVPAPAVGEGGADALAEAGIDPDRIARLRAAGTIA